MERRLFSLAEARELIPALLRLTERAMDQLDEALQAPDADLAPTVERRVRLWAGAVALLGAVPEGLWRVDFDNGAGFDSWRYPETDLDHCHSYGDSFEARTPLQ